MHQRLPRKNFPTLFDVLSGWVKLHKHRGSQAHREKSPNIPIRNFWGTQHKCRKCPKNRVRWLGISISFRNVQKMVTDGLEFWQVSARWVSHLLLENHKQNGLEVSQRLFGRFQLEGDTFFERSVTQSFDWETIEHPSYSPDLSSWDLHLFGPQKEALGG